MRNTVAATTANAVKSSMMTIPAIAPPDSPLPVSSFSSLVTGSNSTAGKPARTNLSILSYTQNKHTITPRWYLDQFTFYMP